MIDELCLDEVEQLLNISHISKYQRSDKNTLKRSTFDTWSEAHDYIMTNRRSFANSHYSEFVVYGYDISDCGHYIDIYTKVLTFNG